MNLKDATAGKLAAGSVALVSFLRRVRVKVDTKGKRLTVTLDIPLRDFGKT